MPYKFGEVVLVQFPFTNQTAFKQRPAVIVSSDAYNASKPDVIIMAVTSQLRSSASLGEVWISQWQSASLLRPSAIKPVFATLEQSLIVRRLGALHAQDLSALRTTLAVVLG